MDSRECLQCGDACLDDYGTEQGYFCDETCMDNWDEDNPIIEVVETEEEEDLPVVHYKIEPMPHVMIGPCPSCSAGVELFGSLLEPTPMDPFIIRAVAGKGFKMKCQGCETIMQAERPLLVSGQEIAPLNRMERRAFLKKTQ